MYFIFRYNELVPDHWCRVELLANFSYGEQHRLIRPKFKSFKAGYEQISFSNCEMFDINYEKVVNDGQLMLPNVTRFVPIKKCSPEDGFVYDQNVFQENAAMHVSWYWFIAIFSNQNQSS